jgi:hypothetical protein
MQCLLLMGMLGNSMVIKLGSFGLKTSERWIRTKGLKQMCYTGSSWAPILAVRLLFFFWSAIALSRFMEKSCATVQLGRAWDSSMNTFSTRDTLENFNVWTFYGGTTNDYVTTGTIFSTCCDVGAFCWPVNYANPEYVQWKMMQLACVPLTCAVERFLATSLWWPPYCN